MHYRIRRINNNNTKASKCTLEVGAVVERIRRVISRAQIDISIEYASDRQRDNRLFEYQPGEVLMRICDARSKEKCIALESNGGENTLMQMGILIPVTCGRIINKNVNVLIREYDAKIKEKEIIEEKLGMKAEWVDKEA